LGPRVSDIGYLARDFTQLATAMVGGNPKRDAE
jgi:hypothetical protein